MTDTDVQGLDADTVERLRRLSRAEAVRTSPWPALDAAVRRSSRRRALGQCATALACAGALALALPPVLSGTQAQVPAAGSSDPAASASPSLRVPVTPPLNAGELPGTRGYGTWSVTAGSVRMVVEFDVRIGSSVPMPEGPGECVVFDHPSVSNIPDGQPVPSLDWFAAEGCPGGIVTQPLRSAVHPTVPFAGQPTGVDIGACSLTGTGPVTTRGGLTATHTSFDCAGGALQQWVFDDQLVWTLDGDERIVGLVETAERVTRD